ncbi:hypothetical protein JCM14076_08010 [Methylosoma difficile]
MTTLEASINVKLRDNPDIAELFRIAESRHLTDAEFQRYSELIPAYADRVAAAKEIMLAEPNVVAITVRQVLTLYPFSKYHELPRDKCTRDVSYVSAYATHSMLMNDPDWFSDKLLLWFKTILQAFSYPIREEKPAQVEVKPLPYPEITAVADTLPNNRRAIYETYARLLKNYQEVLTPKTYDLLQAHLQLALDVLAAE